MTAYRSPTAQRTGLAIAAVAALLTTTAGVANAQGSSPRLPVNNTPIDLPADVCGFPIHVGVVEDREYFKQKDIPDGSTTMRVTGTLINTLTNMDSGATITYNNGGPGTLIIYPDGHVTFNLQGHSMTWVRAEHQARLGAPALRLTSGHVTGTQNTSGDIVELSMNGRVVDGCALLS